MNCLIGGDVLNQKVNPDGFYIKPTLFKGHNKMRIFQEEIFWTSLAVTTFKDEAEALEISKWYNLWFRIRCMVKRCSPNYIEWVEE